MATRERSAGVKNGWRFPLPVYFGIVGGALCILASEMLGARQAISGELRDAGLALGGALVGLVALLLNERFRAAPELAALAREQDLDRQRHQEERRLDFEQYRAVQSELREVRAHNAALQSKLDLIGALDRDRVGDALLLGFYYHRRSERLPSRPHQLVFATAATRLKLMTNKRKDVKLEKTALHEVLEMTYGPIVAESFDLGYILSHLRQEGIAEQRPEILADLERHLDALKLDPTAVSGKATANGANGVFKKLAARIVSIVHPAP